MIQGYDPRTGEPVGEPVAETTDAEVDAIVAAAAAAFPAWGSDAAMPGGQQPSTRWPTRSTTGRGGACGHRRHGDRARRRAADRRGGPHHRAAPAVRWRAARRRGVVTPGRTGYLDSAFTAAEGVVPDLRRINRPVGPVAVFAASNFPFAFSVAGGDTASALAAGCPVVVKAHEGHPVTSDLTAEIVAGALASAGAPAGTFGLVHGVQAGVRLLQHPAIAAAGFTGSTAGGLALARIAAERPVPIPFYGELGSVNPCVVLPGAAFDRPAGDRHRVRRLADAGLRPVLHQPRPAVRARGRRPAVRDRGGRGLVGGRRDAVGPDLRRLRERGGRGRRPPRRHRARGRPARSRAVGRHPAGVPGLAQGVRRRHRGAVPRAVRARRPGHHLPVGRGPAAGPGRAARQPGRHRARRHRLGRGPGAGPPGGRACSSGSRAGSSATAGRPASPSSPPSTTAARGRPPPSPAYTSVGTAAIRRWLVPVAYQDFPPALLPPALRTDA